MTFEGNDITLMVLARYSVWKTLAFAGVAVVLCVAAGVGATSYFDYLVGSGFGRIILIIAYLVCAALLLRWYLPIIWQMVGDGGRAVWIAGPDLYVVREGRKAIPLSSITSVLVTAREFFALDASYLVLPTDGGSRVVIAVSLTDIDARALKRRLDAILASTGKSVSAN